MSHRFTTADEAAELTYDESRLYTFDEPAMLFYHIKRRIDVSVIRNATGKFNVTNVTYAFTTRPTTEQRGDLSSALYKWLWGQGYHFSQIMISGECIKIKISH